MNAPALAGARLGRLSSWFNAAPEEPRAPSPPIPQPPQPQSSARLAVERQLYADIGDFLVAHRLSPTPAHFEVAHAYLAGSDPAIAHAVGSMIAETGTLDHDRIAQLARPAETASQSLSTLAERLEQRLVECMSVADRSHSSARDYGDALDIAQQQLAIDPDGTLAHIAGLTRQVVSTTRLVETELKQTRRETERLRGDLGRARDAAERDHLTGLPNRRGLERRVAEAIGRRDPMQRVTIALCDIDDFKLVNDVHGHQAGDRVLKFVAGFLRTELGDAGCVTRHGGEEFAVLIEGRSSHEAMMLLDDVRERLAARSLVNQDTGLPIGRITFSAGIAALDDDAARSLNDADVALYEAKRAGKNSVFLAPATLRG